MLSVVLKSSPFSNHRDKICFFKIVQESYTTKRIITDHFHDFFPKEKHDKTIWTIIFFFYHQQSFQWYTWKTMCTCRNISFLNISIHYLHINNFQILDKTCYIMLTKWEGNHCKIRQRDNMQII